MDDDREALDVIDAIHTTGARRRLRPDPVPEPVVWAILDAAIRGPSGGNSQRWAWLVVTEEQMKRPIAALYLDAWNELQGGVRARLRQLASRVVGADDPIERKLTEARRDPNFRAGEHLAHHIADAPVWIFAVVRHVARAPTVVDAADVFGAVQNLMLAARAYGLGTTLTMLHRRHEDKVGALLELPPDARALALIPVGYPSSGRFPPTRRQPVETVTHWERWGRRRTPSVSPTGA